MPDVLHVFATDEGDFGWSVESPQVPGFVMGRHTLAELRTELAEALRFAGVNWSHLQFHMTRRYATPEGDEYTIRVAEDATRGDRLEVAWRLESVLATEQRHELLDHAKRTAVGEASFVCAVATDHLGWLTEQLRDERDAFTVAAAVADEGVFTTQLTSNLSLAASGWSTLAEHGWSKATTFGQLVHGLAGAGRTGRLLVIP